MRPSDHLGPWRRLAKWPGRGLVAMALSFTACARMGAPAGGPPDQVPPVIVETRPESVGVYSEFKGEVEFRFDEVISEGSTPSQGTGQGDLEKLVLVSPSSGVPRVSWHRDRLTVKPREGWKPNRVYRVELLPGISDLRRNRSDTSVVLTFTTGAPLPTDTLHGTVVDWVAGKVAVGALVQMSLLPDSLVYRAFTDSAGEFQIGPLPRGDYLLEGVLDQNHNLRQDRREAFDTTSLPAGRVEASALWLFPHDTVGPRIQTITLADSTGLILTFTQPLDPYQPPDSIPVRLLLLPDSAVVSFTALRTVALDDSLARLARAAADSARAAADTTPRKPAPAVPEKAPRPRLEGGRPRPGAEPPARRAVIDTARVKQLLAQRPALFDKLILRRDSAFTPGARYLVQLSGIRNVNRVAGDAAHGVEVPKRPEKPPTPADSAGVAPGDSVRTDPATGKPLPARPAPSPRP